MSVGVLILDLRRTWTPRPRMNSRRKAQVRAKLMLAQSGICAHCEKPFSDVWESGDPDSPTIEHVVARTLGGGNEFSNLLLKHKACNEAGGNRPPSRRDAKWLAIVAERLTA